MAGSFVVGARALPARTRAPNVNREPRSRMRNEYLAITSGWTDLSPPAPTRTTNRSRIWWRDSNTSRVKFAGTVLIYARFGKRTELLIITDFWNRPDPWRIIPSWTNLDLIKDSPCWIVNNCFAYGTTNDYVFQKRSILLIFWMHKFMK